MGVAVINAGCFFFSLFFFKLSVSFFDAIQRQRGAMDRLLKIRIIR